MRQRMEAVMPFASGEAVVRGRVGGVANSSCIHVGSNDAALRLLLLCRIVRGSFQETAPRKIAENTVKHRNASVGSMAANHRYGIECSVVVTTLTCSTVF